MELEKRYGWLIHYLTPPEFEDSVGHHVSIMVLADHYEGAIDVMRKHAGQDAKIRIDKVERMQKIFYDPEYAAPKEEPCEK